MSSTFVEQDCTITGPTGKKFESGGAWLCDCTDGYRRGVVYAKPGKDTYFTGTWGVVTDWHGHEIAKAYFGRVFQGNFCKMRPVSFELDGAKYTGRYCPDWANAVRVRSTKRVNNAKS